VKTPRAIAGPALVGVAALNVVAVAVWNGYDQRIGPLHLVAHDGFKPLQYLAAALFLAWLLKRGAAERDEGGAAWPAWLVPVCVAAGYLPTALINFLHPDWTQAHIGAGVHGWNAIASWFTDQQVDGSYRPFGFCSIWLDYLLFRAAPAGYHLQNIGFHALNVALAAKLYARLGFSRKAASVAALLFAIAPVCAEPVTWPAARYDLLATFFVLGALISAADWLGRERGGRVRLLMVALLTAAAILSKEVGYAAPLLVAALAWSRNLWGLARPSHTRSTAARDEPMSASLGSGDVLDVRSSTPPGVASRPPRIHGLLTRLVTILREKGGLARRPVAPLLIAAGAPAAIGVLVRLAIYHGLGGYSYAQGPSPALSFSAKTVFAVVTRLLITPFAVNTADGITIPAAAALVLFAAATFLAALWCSRPMLVHAALLGFAVLSAVPAAAIIGWVGPSMAASRYLYFPSVWIFALLGRALSTRRMRPVFVLFALGSVAATASNLLHYRDALTLAERAGRLVQADVQSRQGVESVCLVGVPSPSHGVLFFGEQVLGQVRSGLQGRNIAVHLGGAAGCDLVYRWNPATRGLQVTSAP
jgi:hypothetical protein